MAYILVGTHYIKYHTKFGVHMFVNYKVTGIFLRAIAFL